MPVGTAASDEEMQEKHKASLPVPLVFLLERVFNWIRAIIVVHWNRYRKLIVALVKDCIIVPNITTSARFAELLIVTLEKMVWLKMWTGNVFVKVAQNNPIKNMLNIVIEEI